MSLALSLRAEMLKTRRTASFWLALLGAAFIPSLFLVAYLAKSEKIIPELLASPWAMHLLHGWKSLTSFLFPMFVILICALIPQIEFRNNAWKQVFASPQPTAHVFLAKYGAIQAMILLFFIAFNGFMIAVALIANAVNAKFPFFNSPLDGQALLQLSLKTYLSVLSISAIQFWLSLRFKSFVAPVGIGLGLMIMGFIALGFGWAHTNKIPHAFPALTLFSMLGRKGNFSLANHEWYSLGYAAFFLLLGYLDLRFRKERG